MRRPPRPILPWKRYGGATDPFSIGGSGGGAMPAAANRSGSRGFVNNKTGSSGSCNVYMFSCISIYWATKAEPISITIYFRGY